MDGVWSQVEQQNWRYSISGGLSKGERPFELNLPRSLSAIVSRLATSSGDEPSKPFDQIVYLLKTHGSMFSTDPSLRPVPVKLPMPKSGVSRVFLFDSHGEAGERLTSELYGASWWPKDEAPTEDDIPEVPGGMGVK